MRVLLVHNSYQQSGGEDAVVANEKALLAKSGCDVSLLHVHNDEINSLAKRLSTTLNVTYSARGKRLMRAAIAGFCPHVVHVHNFFPLLTPSIYDACREADVPVVQTLHNFRLACAGATLFRDGKPCEACIHGSPYQAAIHGCYRGSHVGSLAVARMIDAHRRRNTWNTRVDRFIALTRFAKERYVAAGLEADRIAVKPNFAPDPGRVPPGALPEREGALFVGRLAPEKGIALLLKAWQGLAVPLTIIGDGPQQSDVIAASGGTITYLGRQTALEVRAAMRRAAFLVMPSGWYEAFPMVIVEAFANSLPVIASRLGAMTEIIDESRNGILFTAGDALDLAAKVQSAAAHPGDVGCAGREARVTYEACYTPQANLRGLLTIYAGVLKERHGAKRTLAMVDLGGPSRSQGADLPGARGSQVIAGKRARSMK